ncbi:geranylgeranylglyceryl/heptaprenylglyceryl phosphate synthase [Bizionia sp. KMM 8389]
METHYQHILKAISRGKRLLAVLIDPDKMPVESVADFMQHVNTSKATHVFVGGSVVADQLTELLVLSIKKHTTLPVVLFPGDVSQVTNYADALLFLSLISGRNPDYLIDKHVQAVSKLDSNRLEVIPTGYVLIENGKTTAVQRVTGTKPLANTNIQLIADTAKAGAYLGMKLIYLEAGSGALFPVSEAIIKKVKAAVNLPLIVGGGIRSALELEKAYQAGADLVVIGTAFETDINFFKHIKK